MGGLGQWKSIGACKEWFTVMTKFRQFTEKQSSTYARKRLKTLVKELIRRRTCSSLACVSSNVHCAIFPFIHPVLPRINKNPSFLMNRLPPLQIYLFHMHCAICFIYMIDQLHCISDCSLCMRNLLTTRKSRLKSNTEKWWNNKKGEPVIPHNEKIK